VLLPELPSLLQRRASSGAVLTEVTPSGLPAPRLADWLRTWTANKIRRNRALVAELTSHGSPDPGAEFLAHRAVRR
jgi:hypothetical protein